MKKEFSHLRHNLVFHRQARTRQHWTLERDAISRCRLLLGVDLRPPPSPPPPFVFERSVSRLKAGLDGSGSSTRRRDRSRSSEAIDAPSRASSRPSARSARSQSLGFSFHKIKIESTRQTSSATIQQVVITLTMKLSTFNVILALGVVSNAFAEVSSFLAPGETPAKIEHKRFDMER